MSSQAERYFYTPQQIRMAHAIESDDANTIHSLIVSGVVEPNEFGLVPKVPASDEQPISFLVYAVMEKKKPAIDALLGAGADVNFHTPDKWSAMAEAARSDDESLLPLLVGRGGDVNTKDNESSPITFLAYKSGHPRSMDFLLDHGADINAKGSMDNTLLIKMAKLHAFVDMLRLMQRGADPLLTSGENKASAGWYVQDSAGRLTPEFEAQRQQVIHAMEAKGVQFPVPQPQGYKWDPQQKKFVLPKQ